MTAQQQSASTPASQPADLQPIPPLPPPPPAIPAVVVPGPAGQTMLFPGIPRTAQELEALKNRREALSDQLNSATNRRNSLAQRVRRAEGADRAGLEQRMQFLDRRILQLESDIAVTGQQLTAAPAELLASSVPAATFARGRRFDFGGGNGPRVGSLVFLVLFLSAAAFVWLRIFTRHVNGSAAHRDADTAQRLARLENAVDSIAVEVERVAEGQRFVTRLLSEASGLPAADRDTLSVPAATARNEADYPRY